MNSEWKITDNAGNEFSGKMKEIVEVMRKKSWYGISNKRDYMLKVSQRFKKIRGIDIDWKSPEGFLLSLEKHDIIKIRRTNETEIFCLRL